MASSSVGRRKAKDGRTEFYARVTEGRPIPSGKLNAKTGKPILTFAHQHFESPFSTLREARKWAFKVKESMHAGVCLICAREQRARAQSNPVTLRHVFDTYLERADAPERWKPKTREEFHGNARWLCRTFGEERDVRTLTVPEMIVWQDERLKGIGGRKVGANRVTALGNTLRTVLDWYVERYPKQLPANPIGGLKGKGAPPGHSRIVEPDEFRAIMRHLPEYLRLPFDLSYHAGLRNQSEVARLTWRLIDLTKGVECIRLPASITKSSKDRTVPLTLFPHLIVQFRERQGIGDALVFPGRDGSGLTKHDFESVFRRALHAAIEQDGVKEVKTFHYPRFGARGEKLTWHSTRHSAVTHLMDARIDPRTVALIAGHTTLKIQAVYDAPKPDSVLEATRNVVLVRK